MLNGYEHTNAFVRFIPASSLLVDELVSQLWEFLHASVDSRNTRPASRSR